ncbi:unnamed protein product [Penicillium glandicola]
MSNASTDTLPSQSSSLLRRSTTVVRVNDERFNVPSPQRKIIIRQLKKALLDQDVPVPFWAVVQLCDLDKLEYIVQLAHFSLRIMDIMADLSCGLPFKWTSTCKPQQVARYAARERDGFKCVITGTRKIFQTVSIFPAGAITSRLQDDPCAPTIWRFVDMFWGQKKTQRWRRAVFNNPTQPESPVNDCTNLICLRRDLRSAWSNGLFALRPHRINDDKTEMEIEFYWQPKPDHKLFDAVDLSKEPISTKNVYSVDRLVVVVGERGDPSYLPIESGYRFKMTTDDPVARPLPDFDLLDMQWHFTRLIALSAAASVFEDDYDDDDDRSSVTTQSPQPSNPAKEDVQTWVESSFSSDSIPDPDPDFDYVEDINASMIGPLPGSDTNQLRSVSQSSRDSERSAGSEGLESAESSTSMMDVVAGTGHLSIGFKGDS